MKRKLLNHNNNNNNNNNNSIAPILGYTPLYRKFWEADISIHNLTLYKWSTFSLVLEY